MKILVTGGAGFIGSHVVRAYLKAGHEVWVLDDLSSGREENLPRGVEMVKADIASGAARKLIEQQRFQAISHHAAQISVPASVEDPVFDAQTNIMGTLNLMQAAFPNGLETFIFISSGGAIYGEVPDAPADELQDLAPISPYAVSKSVGERYLAYFGNKYGVRAFSFRYANVYGPRQIPHGEAGVVAIFMDSVIKGKAPVIYRSPDMPQGMVRDYMFAGDCAKANLMALTARPGVYNLGTSLGTTTYELWENIRDISKSDLECSFGPHRAGDLKRSVISHQKAEAELAWRPSVNLSQGLKTTWQWRLGQESNQ